MLFGAISIAAIQHLNGRFGLSRFAPSHRLVRFIISGFVPLHRSIINTSIRGGGGVGGTAVDYSP